MVTTLRRGFLALALVFAAAIGTAAAAEATTPAGTTPRGDVTIQSWYPGTTAVNGVNLRWHACVNPASYCGYRGSITSAGTRVNIVCQTYGENVNGRWGWSNIWDYVVVYDGTSYRNEGFVADTNITTGYNRIPGVDLCRTN